MPNRHAPLAIAVAFVLLVCLSTFPQARSAPTVITAYRATIPVNIEAAYSPASWNDTPTVYEPASGMNFAVKQNGTGWLFYMSWLRQMRMSACFDEYCYGGIELAGLSNTGAMGTPGTPALMILGSESFPSLAGRSVEEFISTGTVTPTTVQSLGYATQSVCGPLTIVASVYTVQCYRPFELTDASPSDPTSTLGIGSTVEIGFAVGEFNNPGNETATAMNQYQLTFSNSTYSPPITSSSTSSTTATSSSTTTATTTSSSSSSLTTTSATTTTSQATTTVTATTTTTVATTTTISTTATITSITTVTTTTTSPAYSITVNTNAYGYSGTTPGTVSGTVTGRPSPGGTIELVITNPSNIAVFALAIPFPGNGTYSGVFTPGAGWSVAGTYTLTAAYCPGNFQTEATCYTAISQFSYTSPVTASTTRSTSSATPTAVTTTVTTTVTQTKTGSSSSSSTVTSTATATAAPASSATIDWAYAMMVVLLIVGLSIGYVVKLPSAKGS